MLGFSHTYHRGVMMMGVLTILRFLIEVAASNVGFVLASAVMCLYRLVSMWEVDSGLGEMDEAFLGGIRRESGGVVDVVWNGCFNTSFFLFFFFLSFFLRYAKEGAINAETLPTL